jgi:hypothetical protein
MLHYNPRHVSSINMPIFRRKNCITTASGKLYNTRHVSSINMPIFRRKNCIITASGTLYNPRHVSRINMPIFRRKNCIIAASGLVTLCKRLYSMPDDSRLQSSLLSSGILYSHSQRVTIPDAMIIKFVLMKMGMLILEMCRGL